VSIGKKTIMKEHKASDDVGVLSAVIEQFKKLDDDDARRTLLHTVATFLKLDTFNPIPAATVAHSVLSRSSSFTEDRSITPKEFMRQKQPLTSVERVACLAYYLTHYRGIDHFRTLDISKLNTEAAQVKFSNAAMAVNDAVKTGYLVPAIKGSRQISSQGEQFVEALPDREKARSVMSKGRPRRRKARSKKKDNA
jgi:hypothetical protein